MPRRTLQVANFPAPIGGWDTIDSPDAMPPNTAVEMLNLYPGENGVEVRGGTILHCDTGDGTRARTLFSYSGGGTRALLSAHESGTIYDVTTSTASSLATGYSDTEWSWSNFANAAGNYILACNDSGTDAAWAYDGATITPLVVVGLAANQIARVCVYLQRPFYVERNSLSVWYPAAGTYQGALTELDLSSYATKGGTIANIATWTRDNGAGGMDDLFVVVTTRGQVLIYNGIDPSVSTLWVLTGVFDVGEPMDGPSCLVSTGPDLVLICTDGYRPLSDYLALGRSLTTQNQLSYYISGAAKYWTAGLPGARWQGFVYPRRSMLMVSFRISTNLFMQHVANLATGRWAWFIIPASCWGIYADDLYCGVEDGKIYLADTGYGDGDDGETPIGVQLTTASQLVTGGLGKARASTVTPIIRCGSEFDFNIGIVPDYATTSGGFGHGAFGQFNMRTPARYVPQTLPNGTRYTGTQLVSFAAIGNAFAVAMSFNAPLAPVQVMGFRVTYEVGSMV